MNNEQTHLLTHLFNPHCSLWRGALLSWFHSWKTAKLRKLPWLGNARAKIWTHISQPLRPCTSLTHSSVLLTLRCQESHPATRPAALGVALGFLPYGSQDKPRWNWKKSKWQKWKGSLSKHLCWYLTHPFEMLCSWPIKGNLETSVHGTECGFFLTLLFLLYTQQQPSWLNLDMIYLWCSPAPAELVFHACGRLH